MDASRSKAGRGMVPAGLIGMLALVAAVEAFVARREIDAVSAEQWQYLLAGRAAGRQAKGSDLLILGDSQAKMGVYPKVIEARSGLRSYNLAITGAQAPVSYDLLRRALRGGARPKAVVVDFHPLLLATPPRAGRAKFPFLLDFGATLRLGWAARDATLVADLLARRALPTWRCRSTLLARARAAVEGGDGHYRSVLVETLRHWGGNDGAWVMRPATDRAANPPTYPRRWSPDRVNADYLRRFLGLAESNRVPVYWLIPPVHPAFQAANEASGFDARFVAFVRTMQARFPGLVVVDGRHAEYDPAVFFNADHLAREGAFVLSQDLGDILRRPDLAASPGRWIDLPRYRARATDPRIVASRLDVSLPGPAPAAVR